MATGLPDYFSRVFSEMLLQFTDLQDTPGSYVGKANKNVRVNAVESGLEFGGAYFDAGVDADKGAAGRKGRVWWATDSKILYWDDGTDWVEILRSEIATRLASLAEKSFLSLTNVNVDGVHGLLADDQHVLDSEVLALFSALTSYPITITPISGALGSGNTATGYYLTIGKITFLRVRVHFVDIGTAGGYIFSLPNTAKGGAILVGRENGVTGKMLHAYVPFDETYFAVQDYSGNPAIANGYDEFFSGCYEHI